jgi:adenosylhomocysteine nucleosidase
MTPLFHILTLLTSTVFFNLSYAATTLLDDTPRIAVMSAFGPELTLIQSKVEQPARHTLNGVTFTTGRLQGHAVVLFNSGISMTNAAMNTQLVLDRFRVTHLLVSGIAGGVNPDLHIGDVTVVQRWGQYLEVLMAREVKPGQYSIPVWMDDVKLPNFGMLYPRPVGVRSAGHEEEEKKFLFEVDPKMLALARSIDTIALNKCTDGTTSPQKCLSSEPKLVVGGNGVSGQAYIDNADFRSYSFKTFNANVLDMETAAAAQVAYSNGIPFIAFRSLSDLAGGGEGENEISTFMNLAAGNAASVLLAFLAAWQ